MGWRLLFPDIMLTKLFIGSLAFVLALTGLVRFGRMVVRKDISAANALATTLVCSGLILIAWWLVTMGATIESRLVAPLILPSPMEVLQAFPTLHFDQALVRNAMTSFERVFLGFLLAAVVAVPLGVYMGTFPSIGAFFKPVSLVGSYVPIVVFAPITVAWFGPTETQKVVFLFIGCFVALLPMVIKTVSGINGAYLEVAATKGATQWQLVSKVLFPIAAADIWDHLRGAYGVGWGWIILAEVYNGEGGLGYLISISERRGHTNSLFAVVIVIVVIAIICDQLWRLGGELLFPYRRKH